MVESTLGILSNSLNYPDVVFEWHSVSDCMMYRILYMVLLLLVVFGKIPLKTPQHWKFLENVRSCPQFKPFWWCKFLPKNILLKYIFKKNQTTELSLARTFFYPINLTWHPEREFPKGPRTTQSFHWQRQRAALLLLIQLTRSVS